MKRKRNVSLVIICLIAIFSSGYAMSYIGSSASTLDTMVHPDLCPDCSNRTLTIHVPRSHLTCEGDWHDLKGSATIYQSGPKITWVMDYNLNLDNYTLLFCGDMSKISYPGGGGSSGKLGKWGWEQIYGLGVNKCLFMINKGNYKGELKMFFTDMVVEMMSLHDVVMITQDDS